MKKVISAFLVFCALFCMTGCADRTQETFWKDETPLQRMQLRYATGFSVDYYEEGYKLLTLANGSRFLIVPEGKELPYGLEEDVVVLCQPIQNIYLVAMAAMSMFDAMDRLDVIRLSGTKTEGWYLPRVRERMEQGEILYAGKYNEPDYERILQEKCQLAIESTMVERADAVLEKLEEINVPVLIDLSSYESHPLGRCEWIKLYGALLNEEELAEQIFAQQEAYFQEATGFADTGKTVVFFHVSISTENAVIVRTSQDYISQMIMFAGGQYIFEDLHGSNSLSATETLSMESFYARAKDADYILYNTSIAGEVTSLETLLEENPILREFRAVKNGNFWCTSKKMYQDTMQLGQMVQEIHQILTQEAEDCVYFYQPE